MHPVLIQLGPITLYSYGLMVALAFLVGSFWVMHRTEKAGQNVDYYLQAIVIIILAGFAGARLLYVVYFPTVYAHHPLSVLTDRGGLVWYGGLITGTAAFLLYGKWRHLPLAKMADILSAPCALGLAIGRIGCFLSGCCYGKPTNVPWGVQFPPGHETYPLHVHPTELYETFALLLFLPLLNKVYGNSKTPGITACTFFAGYGLIRFIIEFFRGDGLYWLGHWLTASQLFSLIGIVGSVALMLWFKSRSAKRQVVSF